MLNNDKNENKNNESDYNLDRHLRINRHLAIFSIYPLVV